MDKLITSIADVWIDGNDIIHKEVHNNAHVDLNSLKVSFKQTLGYTGPEKRLMLYDLRHHFTITDDALDFLQDTIVSSQGIAMAILSNSIAVRIMTDYVINNKNPKVPLKFCSTEAEAAKWLMAFKKINAVA